MPTVYVLKTVMLAGRKRAAGDPITLSLRDARAVVRMKLASMVSAPTGLTAGTATQTTQPLTWTAASGTPIGYRIETKPASSSRYSRITITANTTVGQVPGLTASTSYNHRVRAIATTMDVGLPSTAITNSTTV